MSVEILEPGALSLRELAAEANAEHAQVLESGVAMVHHAVRAGEALLSAYAVCPEGKWTEWVGDNFDGAPDTAGRYMRIAHYKDAVLAAGARSIREACAHLAAPEFGPRVKGYASMPEWVRVEARRLRAEGASMTAIGRELGVSHQTVARWVDPDADQRQREARNRSLRRRRQADRALREREREQSIRRAVRKAGAATQEAWAMAERMQDVLAQAQRETEDREARRALSEAGVHYRKMRDEIVRALGVT